MKRFAPHEGAWALRANKPAARRFAPTAKKTGYFSQLTAFSTTT